MSYKVICAFTDLQDHNHVYLVGDKFPHDNKNIPENRIKDLTSKNNKIGKPLIEEEKNDFSKKMNQPEEAISFVKANEENNYTKTDINRMNKEDLVSLASEVGIIDAEDKNGSELKKELIEKFGL